MDKLSRQKIKIELHAHTFTSPDSLSSEKDFRKIFDDNIVDKVAITDHSKIGHAFELKKVFGDKIIIGEEIMTSGGEIIGLFLQKEIPKGLSPEETILEIKKQNGIVYIPHPFDTRRAGIARYFDYKKILQQADIIEVFNSRCFSDEANQMAVDFAKENNILQAVGSDAHNPSEIGRSYVELLDFSTPEEFLNNLKSARLVKRKVKLKNIFSPTVNKIKKRFIKYDLQDKTTN